MDSIKSQLLDMGFDEIKVKRAVESCPEAQTLEQVMEWLIVHDNDLDIKPEQTQPSQTSNKDKIKNSMDQESQTNKDNTSADVSSGSEPLNKSEEDNSSAAKKKITVEEAQKLINEIQAKKDEEDRKKRIDDEKRRRIDGQKMAETRAEMQDLERVRLAQQIRKEKMEKEEHRRQVLAQIARDREAMNAKNNLSNTSSGTLSNSKSDASAKQKPPSSTECRVAFRFPDGSNLVHTFPAKETLSSVSSFVKNHKNIRSSLSFVAPPNKKLTDEMFTQTLEELGLCPASRLEVSFKRQSWSEVDCLD